MATQYPVRALQNRPVSKGENAVAVHISPLLWSVSFPLRASLKMSSISVSCGALSPVIHGLLVYFKFITGLRYKC